MKLVYHLFKRGKYFYSEDSRTKKQKSLHTEDRSEAERILSAKNEAANNSQLSQAIGMAYLTASDPEMSTRTWSDVIAFVQKRGKQTTQDRYRRALNRSAFNSIRQKAIAKTLSADFLKVLSDEKQSTNHYLKILHGAALGLGWIVKPILAPKCWPKIIPKPKRAITLSEHSKIIDLENSPERRFYYEILWETGASQSDAAFLSSENIDWINRTIVFCRQKNGQQAIITIGMSLKRILEQLPNCGPLFPKLISRSSTDRAAEFSRRCNVAKIKGISLHSYRYAWAERAFRVGYPERFAQAALGHGSRSIHHAYARRAQVICPALEEYQDRVTLKQCEKCSYGSVNFLSSPCIFLFPQKTHVEAFRFEINSRSKMDLLKRLGFWPTATIYRLGFPAKSDPSSTTLIRRQRQNHTAQFAMLS
jgi:integrase